MTRQLVLASGSATRRMLLDRLRLRYTTAPAAIDEAPLEAESAQALAARLARQKADAVATAYPAALLIGSDQVAVLDGQLLGKPGNAENAFEQLRLASGRPMTFYCGLCLLDARGGTSESAVVPYQVQFRTLTESQIRAYLLAEQPYDCCGSFRAEGLGIALFESHQGEDPTALLGLPLMALTRMLANAGIDVLLSAGCEA